MRPQDSPASPLQVRERHDSMPEFYTGAGGATHTSSGLHSKLCSWRPLVPLLLFSLNQRRGGSFKWSSGPECLPRRLILCAGAQVREKVQGQCSELMSSARLASPWALEIDTPTYLPSCHARLFPWVLETELRSLCLCSSFFTVWVISPTSRHQ